MKALKIPGGIVIGILLLRNLSSLLSTTTAFVESLHGISNGHPSGYWLGYLVGSTMFEIVLLVLLLRMVRR